MKGNTIKRRKRICSERVWYFYLAQAWSFHWPDAEARQEAEKTHQKIMFRRTKSDGDKKVISFYSWSEMAEQDFDKAVIAQYEKEHPDVDVVENFIPYNEYLSKMNTMAAADSMPDVFKLPEANVMEWGTKGAVLDLKPLYDKVGIKPEEKMLEVRHLQVRGQYLGCRMQPCNIGFILQQRFAERSRN